MTPGRERRLALALAMTVSVAVAGCRPGRLRPPPLGLVPSADRLLAAVAARRQRLTALRSVAYISYEGPDGRAGSRHAVVVAPPDRFRLEVLSPLGAVALVTCDGRELALWVRRERRTYRGPATAASVAAYTGVPLRPDDVASVLLGLPPSRQLEPATAAADASLVRVHGGGAGGIEDVWFAPDSLLPVAAETRDGAAETLRVEFADYRAVAGVSFPFRVEVRLDSAGRRIRIRYDQPRLGGAVADELFTIPVRPGVEERHLDERDAGGPPLPADEP